MSKPALLPSPEPPTSSPPRRLYYGWVLVLTLCVTETISWGILYYAFAVFLEPMQAELGWSRLALTGAFSLALLVAGLVGVGYGRWLDRYGSRVLMSVGSVAATGLVLAWSAVDNLAVFYLVWAGLGLAMAAVLYEPAFVVVAKWFVRKRGQALTVLTFVAGFASVIFIPLADWLVHQQGWRSALVSLAGLLAITTIPLHMGLLRREPEDLGLRPDGDEVLSKPTTNLAISAGLNQPIPLVTRPDSPEPPALTAVSIPNPGSPEPLVELEPSFTIQAALSGSAFWWLTAAFFLNTVALVAVTVHLIPYLTGQGYNSSFAASIVGLVGITALPGRLFFTMLGNYLPRSLVAAGLFSLQSLSLVVLLVVQNLAGVFVFVGLFGAGFGAITPARAALVAEFYGRKHYGQISSLLALFTTGARAAGPVGLGLAFDLMGTYQPALWVLAAISGLAALAIGLAHRRRPGITRATPAS